MITDRLRNLLFLIVIGAAVVLSIVALLQAPLGEILFERAGMIRWPQLVILILVEIAFISILVGDETARGALIAKTVLLLSLSVILTTMGGADWLLPFTNETFSIAPAASGGSSGLELKHLVSYLSVPYVMLGLFGIWIVRTSIWPALAR